MAYDFKALKGRIPEVEEWLRREYVGIRTGRATPALLDHVEVEAYGSRTPISGLAALGIEDARTVRISPYDVSIIKEIERGLIASNIGISVAVDDRGLRAIFPELTAERREQLIKLVNQKLEEGRISLRKLRDEVLKDIEKRSKDKEFGEDDRFRHKDELQAHMDEGGAHLEEIAEKKRVELMN